MERVVTRDTPNRQVVLMSRPAGIPAAENFAIREAPVAEPGAGQVLVRNEFLSVDPAMRGWVSAVANYSTPVGIGEVMRSLAAGTVVASGHADYRVGTKIVGMFGWQEYAVVDADRVYRRIGEDDLPLSLSLGVLGLTGATAWLALTEIGRPAPGETVVVSTAAGSVGSAVGQLARKAGARTVGIAGGAAKTDLCTEVFGYDAAVDYRSRTFEADLATACPEGVDVYFDNTSGPISDAVVTHLNRRARIIVCGTAAVSSWDPWPQGPRVERHLLTKVARMEGFLFFEHLHRLGEAVEHLAPLVRSGELRYLEDVLDGLEQAPDAIAGLYRGDNLGKRVIRLSPNVS
jgi:NADPH-dependent curcumin reductase